MIRISSRCLSNVIEVPPREQSLAIATHHRPPVYMSHSVQRRGAWRRTVQRYLWFRAESSKCNNKSTSSESALVLPFATT